MPMTELTPVPPRERVVTLDVLRGFALCGVLIGNMGLYSGQWAELGPAANPTTLDQIAQWFLAIFVHSKAQTLLTLLFGFGFAVQLLRAEERGEPVLGLYLRRLVVLLVLGALHVTLLWWGDVTWGYAIAGFGLLAFMHTSHRARVVWALLLIFVPYLLWMIPEIGLPAMRVLLSPDEFVAGTAQVAAGMRRSDHGGLWWEHLRYALVFSARISLWYFLWLLGRFLLGYVAGKLRWFDRAVPSLASPVPVRPARVGVALRGLPEATGDAARVKRAGRGRVGSSAGVACSDHVLPRSRPWVRPSASNASIVRRSSLVSLSWGWVRRSPRSRASAQCSAADGVRRSRRSKCCAPQVFEPWKQRTNRWLCAGPRATTRPRRAICDRNRPSSLRRRFG